MTLSGLINILPKGFYDSIMKSVIPDYTKPEAHVEVLQSQRLHTDQAVAAHFERSLIKLFRFWGGFLLPRPHR
jgi:hypothetical protein